MRIVSLNAWGGAEYDALAAWLPGCGADVVCLQEVTSTAGQSGWTRFDDGERSLPQRADLFADTAALLPGHQASFLASDAGPVADGAGRSHRQEFGLATFVDRRIPLVGQEASFVHGDFVDHRTWAIADRSRIAHAVRLVDRAGGRAVAVVHLHGLRDPAGKHDTPARLQQARRLAALVERIRRPDDLVVVAGDLNLLPASETFAVLGELGLVDLVGTRDTRTSLYRKPIRHASYLLVSDPSAVRAFDAPATPEVSDHRPLVLDV
ncbi:MAG TPA: endonuclease/exonuclease/phosphatase family protein [Iamia sp.]|nr:endonuclease/exonuclease/phosphatase family protein [Iamia sp.]